MTTYEPCGFAAWLGVVCAAVTIIAQWSGLEATAAGTTNMMLAWGVVSICQAIEWHKRSR